MKRFSSILSKRSGPKAESDSPEDTVKRAVRAFCESGGPTNTTGEEVAHLPVIVESTESTPEAASAAVNTIRKYLGKDNYIYPYKQYNAIMLIRILVDNPGQIFTKNMDAKFEHTVRDLLRYSRDPSVQQLLRETLTTFEHTKKDMPGITALLKMWEKERASMPVPQPALRASGMPRATGFHSNGRPRHSLPGPDELSGRIEEARTTAKLLMQFVSTTPAEEFANHELIKEFADRCVSAQRSLQGYMNCTDPAPDEATLQTLIETCEQLSLASSKHQRAMLAARRQNSSRSETGQQTASPGETGVNNNNGNLLGSGPYQEAPQVPALQPMPRLAAQGATLDPFSDANRVEQQQRGASNGTTNFFNTSANPGLWATTQTQQVHRDDSDDDLYSATPMKKGNGVLGGGQEAAAATAAATAGNGTQSRVKDDEPVTSGTGRAV